MGIDLNAIKQKLQDIKDGVSNNGMRNDFWKPKPGEDGAKKKYKVRIIPFIDNEDGLPFKERWFYYEFNPAILARHKMGKEDPVREMQQTLYEKAGKEPENADMLKEVAKKLWPRERVFAAVIVRPDADNDDEMDDRVGVKLWGFSPSVREELLEKFLDSDYGDITDYLEGHDITIESWKESGFRGYKSKVSVRPRKTPLLIDITPEKLKELQEQIPNLDEIYTLPTYEEVQKRLDTWANSDDDDSTEPVDVGSAGSEKNTRSQKMNDSASVSSNDDDADTKLAALEEKAPANTKSLDEIEKELDAEFDDLKNDLDDLPE